MNKRDRPLFSIPHHRWSVQLTDDGSRTLIDPSNSVAFHSASGGFAETKHVYLENSGVGSRMRRGEPTSVLEIGLGLGLGCLVTLDVARTHDCAVTYTALENDWLPAEVLRSLRFEELLDHPSLAHEWLDWRQSLGDVVDTGRHEHRFGANQTLIVDHGDARTWEPSSEETFDAIYLDPFAPDENPELWTIDFFRRLHRALKSGGCLVSYCVNRRVRDALSAAGFQPEAVPGPPGGKRETLRSFKLASPQ